MELLSLVGAGQRGKMQGDLVGWNCQGILEPNPFLLITQCLWQPWLPSLERVLHNIMQGVHWPGTKNYHKNAASFEYYFLGCALKMKMPGVVALAKWGNTKEPYWL